MLGLKLGWEGTWVCDYLTLYLIEALVGGVTRLRLLHHGVRGNLELA